MKQGKTEVVFVIDRSGSMQRIKDATEQGMFDFVKEQRSQPGECYVSLYEFNRETKSIFQQINVNDVDGYVLVPKGDTALNDAIGIAVEEVGTRLSNTPESERPESVIFCILTDGHENSSYKYNRDQIKSKVEHQTNKYNWKFIFMGANQDSVLVGRSLGFENKHCLDYDHNIKGTSAAFSVMSKGIKSYRNLVADYNGFTEEDRKLAKTD